MSVDPKECFIQRIERAVGDDVLALLGNLKPIIRIRQIHHCCLKEAIADQIFQCSTCPVALIFGKFHLERHLKVALLIGRSSQKIVLVLGLSAFSEFL